VRIAVCGDAWCGTVQWASDKAAADAAHAGTTTLVGTEILHRFVPVGENRWRGRIFVPDLNKRSTAELQVLEADKLQVRGCARGRLLCKTQFWTRADSW